MRPERTPTFDSLYQQFLLLRKKYQGLVSSTDRKTHEENGEQAQKESEALLAALKKLELQQIEDTEKQLIHLLSGMIYFDIASHFNVLTQGYLALKEQNRGLVTGKSSQAYWDLCVTHYEIAANIAPTVLTEHLSQLLGSTSLATIIEDTQRKQVMALISGVNAYAKSFPDRDDTDSESKGEEDSEKDSDDENESSASPFSRP